ncbi:carbohydrate ABC transporter permease [Cohnella sp. 56]|uniref:carbohydrate ABC transporter permease n=1 Tax=Cohnella sp. 56 TaxID=3113722 RepID=UPI0030EA9D3A
MNEKKISVFSIVNLLLLTAVALATLYPFIYMVAVSLSGSNYVLKGMVSWFPRGFNLDMYKLVLQDPRIMHAYVNTIVYASAGTLVALVVTGLGAYALSKPEMLFGRGFTVLIVITMFFSGGMIPTFLVVKEMGIMDTLWAMVLPGAVSTWNLLIMRTFFAGIPRELEESGKLDGLSDLGIFARIVVPLSGAIFATIGLFYAVGLWNNFLNPLLYLRDPDLFPLQVILRNLLLAGQAGAGDLTAAKGGDSVIVEESYKFAVILVSTLPILCVYPFVQRFFVRGVMIGAVKG